MQNDGQTSSLCIGRRWTSTDAQRCLVLSLWHRSAMKGDIERCRKTSADVQRWKYECTISRHLYWNDVTLMVYSEFIARVTSLDASLLCMLRAVRLISHSLRKSLGSNDVARCNSMNSERTIMVHSDFIAAHRSTNICVCNAGGHVQKAVSANVSWCKAIEVWMHSTTIFRFQGPPFWHENYRSTP